MPRAVVEFASSFAKHTPASSVTVDAGDVKEALETAFTSHSLLRSYVLDDRGAVRRHVTIFVNNETIEDRIGLSDKLLENAHIFVFQALSGG